MNLASIIIIIFFLFIVAVTINWNALNQVQEKIISDIKSFNLSTITDMQNIFWEQVEILLKGKPIKPKTVIEG